MDKADAKDVKINIITIATPAVNNPKSPENPANASDAINAHLHIYNRQDKVQITLANVVDGEKYIRNIMDPKNRTG